MSTSTVHPGDLDPSLVDYRTYSSRRRVGRLDTAFVISAMIVLLTMIPAWQVLPGGTDVGRPALVLCLFMWCWWVIVRLSPGLTLVGPQPIRWAIVVYLCSTLASYAVGFLRGLTSMEANSADRWMFHTAAFAGLALAAADGVANWERLRTVLRVLVGCATVMAAIGLVQFVFVIDVVQYLALPGLETKGMVPDLQVRGSSVRAASTTSHYIELGVVLATVLPFAVHFARFSPHPRSRRRYVVCAVLILLGVVATISRTGIGGVLLGTLVLLPWWGWRVRYNLMILAGVAFAGLAVAKPSLARTFLNMFDNAATDPSITSRTERYGMVGYYFFQRPWLGRGSGTWVPPQYQYLDNQWLGTALANGLIGVAALAALHLTALGLVVLALRRSSSIEDKHLCACLIAAQVIAIFAAATFDSLWFSTYATVLALMVGLCGTVWRFTHPARTVRTSMIFAGA